VAPGRESAPIAPEWEQHYAAANVAIRRLEPVPVSPDFLAPTATVLAGLREDPPDVVVADDWRGLAYAALCARKVGRGFRDTAFVVYAHGPSRVLAEAARKVPDTIARFGEEVAQRTCIELADAVVSPSAWLLDWMRGHRWPGAAAAHVIQNLWESVALGQPAPPPASRASIDRLAFFGQIREGKGIAIFIETVRALDPTLLDGKTLLFLGRESKRWTAQRIRDELGPELAAQARFETGLDRARAIEELRQPGTLVVLPTLLENSPYAVAECLEHGIPFVASRVGGLPELIAEPDRDRVLAEPTAGAFALAVARALMGAIAPARPAKSPDAELEEWLRLVETVRPRPRLQSSGVTSLEVVEPTTVEDASAEWVVLVDDADAPDADMVEALVSAQAASGADVVTTAVRPSDLPGTVRMFLGNPGALGLVENHYGVVGLVRRALVLRGEPDWPLFARLALSGARIVSIPDPLAAYAGLPGTVADVPGDGLAVLRVFEEDGQNVPDLPQLAATLSASRRGSDAPPAATEARSRFRLRGVLR
jgi:glycosyltransferase involved in cell wall biosynthesis